MGHKQSVLPTLCVYCGELALLRRDKHGRPYVACASCGSHHFFRTPKAELGYMVTQELLRANLAWFTSELSARYSAHILAIQSGQTADATAPAKKSRTRTR